jgi:hypothetical protein
MHSIGVHRESDVGPVVEYKDSARFAHALSDPLRTHVKLTGTRVLVSKLNQPDARRYKCRRNLLGGTAGPLSGVNYGIEAGKDKIIGGSGDQGIGRFTH